MLQNVVQAYVASDCMGQHVHYRSLTRNNTGHTGQKLVYNKMLTIKLRDECDANAETGIRNAI